MSENNVEKLDFGSLRVISGTPSPQPMSRKTSFDSDSPRSLMLFMRSIKRAIEDLQTGIDTLVSETKNSPRAKTVSRLEASIGNYQLSLTKIRDLTETVQDMSITIEELTRVMVILVKDQELIMKALNLREIKLESSGECTLSGSEEEEVVGIRKVPRSSSSHSLRG